MSVEETKERLIGAVSRVIGQGGFPALGINRIAREAGCDKVLIYRYFGGLEGLLEAWARRNDFYASAYEVFADRIAAASPGALRGLAKEVLLDHMEELRRNRLMQELLLWELAGHSELRMLQDLRENGGYRLQQAIAGKLGIASAGSELYITLLIAGVDYLVLYTRGYSRFNGTDFSDPASWQRLRTVVGDYVDMLFDKLGV